MGQHRMLSQQPYVFERSLKTESLQDYVIVALDFAQKPANQAKHQIPAGAFKEGQVVRDAYSGQGKGQTRHLGFDGSCRSYC